MNGHLRNVLRAALLILIASVGEATSAEAAASGNAVRGFVQLGTTEQGTRSFLAGLTREWGWRRDYEAATLSGYWEIAAGRWKADQPPAGAGDGSTQVSITPVLRLQSVRGMRSWFVEAGVGATLISPTYRNEQRRFGSAFNFGDHLAVGRYLGPGREHELALRVEHLSNGGLAQPNPGENFLQLRYSHIL